MCDLCDPSVCSTPDRAYASATLQAPSSVATSEPHSHPDAEPPPGLCRLCIPETGRELNCAGFGSSQSSQGIGDNRVRCSPRIRSHQACMNRCRTQVQQARRHGACRLPASSGRHASTSSLHRWAAVLYTAGGLALCGAAAAQSPAHADAEPLSKLTAVRTISNAAETAYAARLHALRLSPVASLWF